MVALVSITLLREPWAPATCNSLILFVTNTPGSRSDSRNHNQEVLI